MLSAERRQVDNKLESLRAELDHKLAAQRGQEGELDRFQGELEKESQSEKINFELQTVSKMLGAAGQLAEERKPELERERSAFQKEKACLQLDLQHVISEREEAERQADEDPERLQKQSKSSSS